MLGAAARFVLDTFAPARCAACDAVTGDALCAACRADLAGAPLPPVRRTAHGVAAAAFDYGGPIRAVLHRGKYRGNRAVLRLLGGIAAPRLQAAGLGAPDVLVPVPLGARRRQQRGYNQAEVIAERLGDAIGRPLLPWLVRDRETPPQADLDEAARLRNVASAFRWHGPSLRGRAVWVVDDVLTTGATSGEAARTLLDAGAGRVECAVLALVR